MCSKALTEQNGGLHTSGSRRESLTPHRVSRPNKPLLTGGSPNVEIMLSGECSEIGWGHRNEHRDEMNLGGRVTARLPESRKIN